MLVVLGNRINQLLTNQGERMKRMWMALAMTGVCTTASAANFVGVDVDRVTDTKNGASSQAQYVRAGKDVGAWNLGLQVRTAVFERGGMLNSVEGTLGREVVKGVQMFGGVGYDNGFNGASNGSFSYGVVGAVAGAPVGQFWTYGGVKTRVNWETSAPQQTLVFVGASLPITKSLSVNAGLSRSYQDINEKAWGVGARLAF